MPMRARSIRPAALRFRMIGKIWFSSPYHTVAYSQYSSRYRVHFVHRPRVPGVIATADFAADLCIEILSANASASPHGVDNCVQPLPRRADLRRRNVSQRLCSFRRLVMTSDVIPADVAYPERQRLQVCAVRINLATVRQPRINITGTTAAENAPSVGLHCAHRSEWNIRPIVEVIESARLRLPPRLLLLLRPAFLPVEKLHFLRDNLGRVVRLAVLLPLAGAQGAG